VATARGDILLFDVREKMLEDRTAYPLLRKISSKTGEGLA
jgi:hypothetical protein